MKGETAAPRGENVTVTGQELRSINEYQAFIGTGFALQDERALPLCSE